MLLSTLTLPPTFPLHLGERLLRDASDREHQAPKRQDVARLFDGGSTFSARRPLKGRHLCESGLSRVAA